MKCDVSIIGAGFTGLLQACLLARGGVSVVCIDRADPEDLIAGDERTMAISYGSQAVFERAGVWRHLDEGQICAIRDIQILDGDSPLLLNFLSSEVENKSFGWIVETKDLRRALLKEASEHDNLTLLAPANIEDFSVTEKSASVILEGGDTIKSGLIIGADGRRSKVRGFMDVAVRNYDYKQTAHVCMITHENPHDNIAVEHFLPDGPFAVLPAQDDEAGRHRSSVVLSIHGNKNVDIPQCLVELMPDFYGSFEIISNIQKYPLSLSHAADYVAPRTALIADAAHGIHPIAGQGLNLGVRDVAEMADLLIEAKARGEDLGALELLKTYERCRRPDNVAMIAATDILNKLFSNNSKTVGIARRLGLKAVSKLPLAKRFFMKQAMADR